MTLNLPDSMSLMINQPWHNVPGNLQVPLIERQYDVWNHGANGGDNWRTAVANIVTIIQEAETLGRRVRAVGAAFSMAPVAVTTDHLVNTVFYNQVFRGFQAAHLQTNRNPASYVHAQAGARVADLHQVLRARNAQLPTVGSSDGQTICGAVSTGTHGSGLLRGSLADYVRAIHIIGEGGKQYWLERESEPIVANALPVVIGAQLLRDDALFNAVVVGFGSFGIVHSLVLEVLPIFALRRMRRKVDLDANLREVMRTLDFTKIVLPQPGTPYHFDVVINPHAAANGQDGAYVTMYYPEDVSLAVSPTFDSDGQALGDDVGRILGGLISVIPSAVPLALPGLMGSIYGEADTVGTLGDLFRRSITPRFAPISTEIGVALADAERTLDVILHVIDAMKPGYYYPGIVAARYVQPTRSTLGFTRFGPLTCTFEVPALAGVQGNLGFYNRLWMTLRSSGIPFTLHWGQLHDWTPDTLRSADAYGTAVDDWIDARHEFLGPTGRRTFSNEMLDRYGLAD